MPNGQPYNIGGIQTKIESIVHSCNGYFYESAGVITAFFNDPQQALDCANKIQSIVGLEVAVCGDQLAIELP